MQLLRHLGHRRQCPKMGSRRIRTSHQSGRDRSYQVFRRVHALDRVLGGDGASRKDPAHVWLPQRRTISSCFSMALGLGIDFGSSKSFLTKIYRLVSSSASPSPPCASTHPSTSSICTICYAISTACGLSARSCPAWSRHTGIAPTLYSTAQVSLPRPCQAWRIPRSSQRGARSSSSRRRRLRTSP